MMRMYACENARGNVLEPEGMVEIKFRKPDMLKAMRRNDATYAALEEGSAEAKARERELMPVYNQMAVHFASLHDTPGVMKQKGVISSIVPWAQSRAFFYKALRERLAEVALDNAVAKEVPSFTEEQRAALLAGELKEALGDLANGTCHMSDVRISSCLSKLRHQHEAELVAKMPVDAVLTGLLKEHTPEALMAMLGVKAISLEE
eukprot:6307586-Pyramimonas_sp.AAC.1